MHDALVEAALLNDIYPPMEKLFKDPTHVDKIHNAAGHRAERIKDWDSIYKDGNVQKWIDALRSLSARDRGTHIPLEPWLTTKPIDPDDAEELPPYCDHARCVGWDRFAIEYHSQRCEGLMSIQRLKDTRDYLETHPRARRFRVELRKAKGNDAVKEFERKLEEFVGEIEIEIAIYEKGVKRLTKMLAGMLEKKQSADAEAEAAAVKKVCKKAKGKA